MKIFVIGIIVFCSILSFVSCSDEDVILQNETNSSKISEHHIPLESALATASDFFKEIDTVSTRGNGRMVDTVDYILSEDTRGDNADTLLYLVNYQYNQGFAILGADDRALPVYAISDSGNFQLREENSMLEDLLESYGDDAMSRIIADNGNKYDVNDSVPLPGTIGGSIGGADPPYWGGLTKEVIIHPMISAHQSQIGSTKELSKYCFTSDGKQGRTGCGALAMETLMSYYKWPTKYRNVVFHWDEMNNGQNDDDIAKLLGFLGRPENLNLTYVDENTYGTCVSTRVPGTFLNFNYNYPGDFFMSFYKNEQYAHLALFSGPLLMHGESTHFQSGHLWVIDGLMHYIRQFPNPEYDMMNPVITVTYHLYHCMWADFGNCNGYYLVNTSGFIGVPDEMGPVDNEREPYFRQLDKNIGYMAYFKRSPVN